MYALRGEWERVGSRAQQVIDLAPSAQKKFMVDEHFYLALARGDVGGMEDALTELTSEKMARVRNNQLEFGFTHFFIGTHAVMYAKRAWLHGYQVKSTRHTSRRSGCQLHPCRSTKTRIPSCGTSTFQRH